ncbi:UNVERIFIED_ORG: hypothetical protein E4P37_03495 [Bacillus sp. AZ43]
MTTRSRTATALLSILLAAPFLAACGEGEPSEAAATSAATTQGASEDAATGSTAPGETADDSTDAPDFPSGTDAVTSEASADAAVTVGEIRVGAHDGYDRVVLELGGTGTPGWDVRYVDAAVSQGSGETVDVAGGAVLQVTLTGAGYPYDTGVEEVGRGPVSGSGTTSVEEVVFDATFEGTSVAFVGTSGKLPFRVYALSDPTRVVVEVAHAG